MISKSGRIVFAVCTLTLSLLGVYLQITQTTHINYFPGGRGGGGFRVINSHVVYCCSAIVLSIWILAEIKHNKTKKKYKL